MPVYKTEFFRKRSLGALRSARAVVPVVLELLNVESVVDVGCGTGSWLRAFDEAGVHEIQGIDGDYVDRALLEIPVDRFLPRDLKQALVFHRRFDLVVSLEVAEHLPPDAAEVFIQSLTGLGPVVLFSAAVPHQGGTHHLNEQWPDYWASLFESRDYVAVDCLRHRIWNDDTVSWYYRQNAVIFVKRQQLHSYPRLEHEYTATGGTVQRIVHPAFLETKIDHLEGLYHFQKLCRELLEMLPSQGRIILVDDGHFGAPGDGSQIVPFLERGGTYWGNPEDSQVAITELTRLVQAGAKIIAFAWPAFWWLDYYSDFSKYLYAQFRCVRSDERAIVFDLRS
jgi:SAM-dependent methyltransferase